MMMMMMMMMMMPVLLTVDNKQLNSVLLAIKHAVCMHFD